MNSNRELIKRVLLALAALVSFGPVAINVYDIPFTLQTLIICLITYYFRWQGFIAVLIYIGLGLLGLPVWSNYHIDTAILSTPSAGFVLGFIPMAAFLALVRNKMTPFLQRMGLFFLAHIILFVWAMVINQLINMGMVDPFNLLLKFSPGIVIKTVLATLFTWALANLFSPNKKST
jgi:biotin transport system substrate-specific component